MSSVPYVRVRRAYSWFRPRPDVCRTWFASCSVGTGLFWCKSKQHLHSTGNLPLMTLRICGAYLQSCLKLYHGVILNNKNLRDSICNVQLIFTLIITDTNRASTNLYPLLSLDNSSNHHALYSLATVLRDSTDDGRMLRLSGMLHVTGFPSTSLHGQTLKTL
jgi:hypothetical protein